MSKSKKKTKSNDTKKLQRLAVRRDVLRNLNDDDLDKVGGGGVADPPIGCWPVTRGNK